LAEIETDEEKDRREAYEYYQEFVAGPRSLTPMELHTIPKLVDIHGLAAFTKASFAAANKVNLSSPIRYVEVTLDKWAEADQRAVIDKLYEVKREVVEPASDAKVRKTLETAAAGGNLFAKRILRDRGESCTE
jgi:predicted TPR repeat methyltransferase